MALLEAVTEHRTVLLGEDVTANLNDKIGSYAEDVAVEGGVVDLAQRQAVGHYGLAERIGVRNDVGGVEQLAFAQAANGASGAVGSDDSVTEAGLVEALSDLLGDVGAPGLVDDEQAEVGPEDVVVLEGDGEGQVVTIVVVDEGGPERFVQSLGHAREPNERNPLRPRSSEAAMRVTARHRSA